MSLSRRVQDAKAAYRARVDNIEMSKYRRAAKIDANQPEIVKALRSIPGVSVELNHDDLLVGYKGVTYWYELKDGKPAPSDIKKDQYRIWETWTGHYKIVWTLDMILEDIGISV